MEMGYWVVCLQPERREWKWCPVICELKLLMQSSRVALSRRKQILGSRRMKSGRRSQKTFARFRGCRSLTTSSESSSSKPLQGVSPQTNPPQKPPRSSQPNRVRQSCLYHHVEKTKSMLSFNGSPITLINEEVISETVECVRTYRVFFSEPFRC